ncbi:MAG: putative phage tail protein [Pseudomonadota bacterium]
MALSAADYTAQLQALLPQGAAWPRDADATLTKLLRALAEELARVDARAEDLLDEADPRTAYELLADWERVAGLPDPCTPAGASLEARRLSLVQRLTMLGGASRQYFIDLAAALGYAGATVSEFRPFSCTSECDDALNPAPAWPHAWQLNLPATRITPATCTSGCDAYLAVWGDSTLECVVERLKPAHTEVLFTYGA